VEQERLTLPEHLSSSPVFSGVRVTRSAILCVCFVDRCLSFYPFAFGHCVVCSSIYGFWLHLWYLQTLLISNTIDLSSFLKFVLIFEIKLLIFYCSEYHFKNKLVLYLRYCTKLFHCKILLCLRKERLHIPTLFVDLLSTPAFLVPTPVPCRLIPGVINVIGNVKTTYSQSNFHCVKVSSKSATRLFYRPFSNLFCNTTGVTSGAGTTYPFGAPEFTPGSELSSCYSIFSFICMFCRSLFVLLNRNPWFSRFFVSSNPLARKSR
jgi:hypothetical protein